MKITPGFWWWFSELRLEMQEWKLRAHGIGPFEFVSVKDTNGDAHVFLGLCVKLGRELGRKMDSWDSLDVDDS